MNKRALLILLLASLCHLLHAKPVDPQVATRVARNTLHKEVVDITPATFSHCFLFAGADGQGFALVAGDDCVRPLLAYSMDESFATDRLPEHISHWIDGYQLDIAALAEAGAVASPTVTAEWERRLGGIKYHALRDTAVGPLMSTRWNQYPLYNSLCPTNCVTGCVATAMAQVMKYWNHPAVGRGSHSYGLAGTGTLSAQFDTTHYAWGSMPDVLNRNSTESQVYAVAQLMYHAGVAVDMTYGSTSSAYTTSNGDPSKASSENALKDYFRYNQGMFSIAKVDYSDSEWDALLTDELNASRPILVSGNDGEGGHAFVIDGYDSTGFFHLNWGWGGYCDGYYTLDSLNPDGSGIGGNATNGYNNDCTALIHIFPASEDATVSVNVAANDPLMGAALGGGTYASYTPIILTARASEGHLFKSWASGCHYNPFRLSPNNDFTDTAVFVPLTGDTLGYCYDRLVAYWGEFGGAPEWGIRIPASSFGRRRELAQVQVYAVGGRAEYTLKVYRSSMPTEMVYTSTQILQQGWNTITLESPIPLRDTMPLWIVFSCLTYSNPATISNYTGNPDGTWYKQGSSWTHLENHGHYASWMIRAVTAALTPVQLNVTANNPSMGTVSGGGTYYPGDTAILTATPTPGYHFAGWSTGHTDNPLHYVVSQNASIVATFLAGSGIDDVDDGKWSVEVSGLDLTVYNPEGTPVELYDLTGRLLATSHLSPFTFHLTTPGVYLLSSPSHTQKIVVQN